MISGFKPGAWLKSHSHHLIFAITLISLTALVSWWSVFIRQAIVQQYNQKYEQIKNDIRWQSMMLGHDPEYQVIPGNISECEHLEIVQKAEYEEPYSHELVPYSNGWFIQPVKSVIDEIEADFLSKKKMILGESTFLVMLIIVSSLMLYRLIWVERRAAAELKEFWNRVTHEIKTPITGLKAFLQTLKSHNLSPEEMDKYLSMALAQVERQEQLADNLLVGQRLNRTRDEFNPVTLDLKSYVESYFRDQHLIFRNSQVEIEARKPVYVRCDPDALRVILNNLSENAIKFTGDDLVLKVKVEVEKKTGRMTVSDNGPGFDPRKSKNIFDAYHRLTKELPKGAHGTGMGLYISRQLARKMGGNLQGFSEGRGSGAQFMLTLKRSKENTGA